MRRHYPGVAAAVVMAALCAFVGTGPASGASSPTQGVTATTIRVGVAYVDVAAVKAVGVNLNWGNVTEAYTAMFANVNAHGGINGRKIVPYIVPVDPTGTAPAATACTELTQDDKVFVVMAPLEPSCYQEHNTPVLAGIFAGATAAGAQPDFTLVPPTTAFDPLQLKVFDQLGLFKNKKVGVFAGDTGDDPELSIVLAALKSLHVDVIQSATDSAPEGDLSAENEDQAVIAQKFESSGVNEVVAVGTGSAIWAEGEGANQSSYAPPWVVTSAGSLAGSIIAPEVPYLKNLTAADGIPPGESIWQQSQGCVKIIKKADPSDQINAYKLGLPTSEITYTGPEDACTDVALFTAIAKAAGKNLTVASFDRAAYGLRNVTIPGAGTISFAPGRPYAIGPVYVGHYESGPNTIVYQTTPAKGT